MALNTGKKRKANKKEKQNKYSSKSLTRIVISLFLAIVAWIAATSFEAYLLSDKNTETVIVATKDIPAGTWIDENNYSNYFGTKIVNSNLVTKETMSDASLIKGKVIVNISQGEMITSNRFLDTSYVDTSIVDPVSFTFTVDDMLNAVCGEIRRGDLVDIIGVFDGNHGSAAKIIRKNAYIVEAYDVSGKSIADDDFTTQAVSFKIYIERNNAPSYSLTFNETPVTVVKVVDYTNTLQQTTNNNATDIVTDFLNAVIDANTTETLDDTENTDSTDIEDNTVISTEDVANTESIEDTENEVADDTENID